MKFDRIVDNCRKNPLLSVDFAEVSCVENLKDGAKVRENDKHLEYNTGHDVVFEICLKMRL